MGTRKDRRGSILILVETIAVVLLIIGFLAAVQFSSKKEPVVPADKADYATSTKAALPQRAVSSKPQAVIEPFRLRPAAGYNTIIFNGTGFVPSKLEVWPSNRSVIFKNQSKVNMWIASDPHPTHSGLPGFNQGVALPPGGTYTYTFPAGEALYGFHNHLSPSQRGTILVK